MTTERQVRANRSNAKRSTGPKSEGGKGRASQNARKHGLYALKGILEGSEAELYARTRQDAFEIYCPEGAVEEGIVEQIVLNALKINRMDRAEAELINRLSAAAAAREQFEVQAPVLIVNAKPHTFDADTERMLVAAGRELDWTEDVTNEALGNVVCNAETRQAMSLINRIRSSALRAIRMCEDRLDALGKRRMFREPQPPRSLRRTRS